MITTVQRPTLSFKVPLETYERLERFCAEHPMIPKSRIIVKALDFYLSKAALGVDPHLNPSRDKRG